MKNSRSVHWRMLATALIAILVFAAYLSLVISGPSDGAHLRINTQWQQDGIVASLMTEGTEGLREGDLIVSIDGHEKKIPVSVPVSECGARGTHA